MGKESMKKTMGKYSFFKDDRARVPFAVIGIFMILISTAASINLARLDIKMGKTMSSNLEVTAPDRALHYARADIARAINYAGMDALKQLGETPVISPNTESEYYIGTNGDVNEFNKNRVRGIINRTLNTYIESNYMYDAFVYDGFSINFEPPQNRDRIKMETVMMKLERKLNSPLLSPSRGKYADGYGTYWKVSVPLTIHLKNLKTHTELMTENITVETVITSRYPLLKDMTEEYAGRLNGTNEVMTEVTAFAMAYTWGRGYMQYYREEPLNIVDNNHLALIINGAVLLDQGLVFNSADPASIFEYANKTAITLSGNRKDYRDISLSNKSLRISPQNDAFNSTGNPQGAEEASNNAKRYDYNTVPFTDHLNNRSAPGGSIVSRQIQTIIPQVYSTKLATGVARQTTVERGGHDGYETDYSESGWGEPDSMDKVGVIARDSYVPGNLFGEIWDVKWTQDHVWRHYYTVNYECTLTRYYGCFDSDGNPSICSETYTTTCSRTEYDEMTTTDERKDRVAITLKAKENSNTSVSHNFSKSTLSSKNDVHDVYSTIEVDYNNVHDDPNLEGAYLIYKADVFDPGKESNLKNKDLNNDNFDQRTYEPETPGWVAQETQYAVDGITNAITNDVHLEPQINYTGYPVPSEFLNAARQDLLNKIEKNESNYTDIGRYRDAGIYNSASSKVISLVREWYVDEIKYQIKEKFTQGSDRIEREINNGFSQPEKVKGANRNATKLLSEDMNIPLGLTMKAYHVDNGGKPFPDNDINSWNESVTLSINQEPNYLDPDRPYPGDMRLYTLKVRNNDLLGATGLPILPTFDPWITTVNAWSIDVEGEFVKFEVHDIDDEVHPDPVFGHETQVFVRKYEKIRDPVTNSFIGENSRIKFNFTTGTFITVPPGKLTGVGDKNQVNPVEESEGYRVIR